MSLFSNCGAGDLGFRQAGFCFDVLAEIDPHRLAVAKENHTSASAVLGDLREMWPLVVTEYWGQAGDERLDLLSACPPCQGMSTARARRGSDDDVEAGGRDPRNLLVLPIAEVAAALRPRVIVVENVQQFLTRKVPHPDTGEGISAARLLLSLLDSVYEVFPVVVDLAEYGIPQHRVRTFLTFVDRDEAFIELLHKEGRAPFPEPTHGLKPGQNPLVSLRDALLASGSTPLDARFPAEARSQELPLHEVPCLDENQYAMVKAIPPHSGRSAWESKECPSCGMVDAEEDDATCRICGSVLLRPVTRDEDGRPRLVRGFRNSSYRRMNPDQPAATVTTASNRISSDNTIHPWEHRVLSAWECQMLQGFPPDFKWGSVLEAGHLGLIREMIGEAVPPAFTFRHGEILFAFLNSVETVPLLSLTDERVVRARAKLFGVGQK